MIFGIFAQMIYTHLSENESETKFSSQRDLHSSDMFFFKWISKQKNYFSWKELLLKQESYHSSENLLFKQHYVW